MDKLTHSAGVNCGDSAIGRTREEYYTELRREYSSILRTSHHMCPTHAPLRVPRSLLLVAGLLLCSLLSWAQIGLVHVTSCGPQTFPASTCTIPSTGSGNVLVVAWTSASGGGGTTIAGVTDNANNVYSEAGGARATDTAANTMADIWYAENSVAGSTVVTITPSPSGATGTAVIWEFSGVEPFSPLDQTAVLNSQAATATPLGASVVTTSPAEVIISVANVQGTVTAIKSGSSF